LLKRVVSRHIVELLILCVASLLASALTLFSGFGLGTLLMPVVALFFRLELAIAMTAMVHLANNLFKIGLLGKQADRTVVLKFGLPAIAAAFVGAGLLLYLGEAEPIYEYEALGSNQQVSIIKLVIGTLIVFFVVLELSPTFSRTALDRSRSEVSSVGSSADCRGIKAPFAACPCSRRVLRRRHLSPQGLCLP
jgi:uncharacterized protein